jgi:hypothetical protein
MRNIILAAGLAMLLAHVGMSARQRPIDYAVNTYPRTDRQALADFQARVDRYVALHRQIEETTPPIVVSDDWSSIRESIDALAGKIRTARANARQGDVFTPEVERWFRLTLGECLAGVDIEDFLADINEEEWKDFVLVPDVNGRWPAGAPLPTMPPHLLAVLPQLPEELQYRFMHRDLILWDVHANVMVDFIRGALMSSAPSMCCSGTRGSTDHLLR